MRLSALKNLTETYEDVAVASMQEIRQATLANREFLAGVGRIHALAKSAYLAQILATLGRKQREAALEAIAKNRKSAVVFISGNHSLLGNVVFQTYKVFLDLVGKIECDLVILGAIGRYLASGERPPLTFAYFDLDDFSISESQIKPIVQHISRYQKIFVVYPKFDTVLAQSPAIDDISGGAGAETNLAARKRYFFEPSAGEVMAYFEGQIIGTLFRQKVLESMLAKFASRLAIMDEATQKIGAIIARQEIWQKVAKRRQENEKLRESFAGISLWEEGR